MADWCGCIYADAHCHGGKEGQRCRAKAFGVAPDGSPPQPPAPPKYAALEVDATVNGKDVLLAVRKDPDPEKRRVIALFPNEARWLHDADRLDHWTPEEATDAH